ncbi:hypothetical protein LUZ60_000163 [Juncus effusus]|nr:hypothetical protein LUZ60_000163 [Juncus effusus]
MASKSPMLTLTIDKSTNRVVFAEADKDFVDILLSFLTLPLGTIVSLTKNNSTPFPCLNNLYKSVKDLNDEYFKINPGKDLLLRPSYEAEMECLHLAVNLEGDRVLTYYTCSQDCDYGIWSPYLNTKCNCGALMSRKVKIAREAGKEGVFLRGVMRFIITDDFVIMPASTQAAMKLISGLCVSNLEERNITVGRSEVLALLQSSLASNRALTDVFIAREIDNARVALHEKLDSLTLNPKPISSQSDNNSNNNNICIKIIIDKHENKVLYAESNQDFANLLFGFLTYPSGSVVKNLNQNSRITCFDNLYASVLKPDIADSFKMLLLLEAALGSETALTDAFMKAIIEDK